MINSDPIQFWEPLLHVIRSAEASPDNKKNGTTQYDSVVAAKPLARLDTVSIQEAVKLAEDERTDSKYIGAYQLNKDNLVGGDKWATKAGLQVTDLFNKKNQDTIAIYLITKIRKGADWLNGDLITDKFMVKLAQEWAGLPVPYALTNTKNKKIKAGQSYWTGTSTNRVNVSVSKVVMALDSIYLSYTGEYPNYVSSDIKNDNTSDGISPITTSSLADEQLQILDPSNSNHIQSPFGSISEDDFNGIVSEEQYLQFNSDS